MNAVSKRRGISLLRAEGHRRMPWKNGLGETTEIAVFPDAAGLSDFHWRVSMASVARDGPFSVFDGVERTLSLLEGAGLELTVAGRPPVFIGMDSAPYSFPGDVETLGRLRDGPIRDLNIMTRRGHVRQMVRAFRLGAARTCQCTAATTLVLATGGDCLLSGPDAKVTLGALDCAVMTDRGCRVRLSGGPPVRVFIIALDPVGQDCSGVLTD